MTSRKKISRVIIRGGTAKLQHEIRRLLGVKPTVSLESEQMTQVQDRDEAMSLFLFKPSQTGFSAVAEMTAAAIKDPDNTMVVSIPDEDETDPVRIEREATADVLKETGVPVFEDLDEAAKFLDGLAAETTTEEEGGTGNY